MVNGTLNKWDVYIAHTNTKSHNTRPIVIYEDKGDFVWAYLCGSDRLQKQKDGKIMLVSDFYITHPSLGIKPVPLDNWRDYGLTMSTYVNVDELRAIPKCDINGFKEGELSKEDIAKIEQKVGLKESITLNEDLFDEVEETLSGPQSGEASGVADELMNLIKDELEAIQRYNGFIATISELDGFEHMKETIEHINTEENKHIGELQTLLKTISPNAEMIDSGQEEASNEIGDNMKVISESIKNFDNIDGIAKVASLDPVTADAIVVSKRKRKELEKSAKEMKAKVTDQGAIIQDNETKESKKVTSSDLKKMHLSEDLFEDVLVNGKKASPIKMLVGKLFIPDSTDIKSFNVQETEDNEHMFDIDLDCDAFLNNTQIRSRDGSQSIGEKTPIKITNVLLENWDDYKEPTLLDIKNCINNAEIEIMLHGPIDSEIQCWEDDIKILDDSTGFILKSIAFELKDNLNENKKLRKSKKVNESIKDKFDAIQDELVKIRLGKGKKFEESEIGAYFGENGEEGIKITTNDPVKIEKLKEIAKKYKAPFKETDKKHYKDITKKIGTDSLGLDVLSHKLGSDDIHSFIIITNKDSVEEELLSTEQKLQQNQQQNTQNTQQQDNNVQNAYNKAKQSNFTNQNDLAELEKQLGIKK